MFQVSQFKSHERGFTLVELLVSIAIIGILASVVTVGVSTGRKQQDIQRAAQKLVFDLRRAQNSALAPSATSTCFYGLKIDASKISYFIYSNIAPCPVEKRYDENPSNIEETISFGNGISVINADVSGLDFTFEPPEPITYMGGVGGALSATVTISRSDCPECVSRSVRVNRFGQVEIQ